MVYLGAEGCFVRNMLDSGRTSDSEVIKSRTQDVGLRKHSRENSRFLKRIGMP